MDAAAASGSGDGAEDRRALRGGDRPHHAEKNDLKPWQRKMWCIPPEQDAEFVCAMENVLETYKRPYDPKRPVVCFDEKSKQLVAETCKPIQARPGEPERCDYEYVRAGTANLFMMVEPLRGWRKVNVTTRRTKVEFALQVKELVDVHFPTAERITLVLDNLNTHTKGAFYEAFDPERARAYVKRIKFCYTPKHGSWLNVAECELSCLTSQCLRGRRIGELAELQSEIGAWSDATNAKQRGVDWQFRIDDARVKLKRLYPKIKT